MKKRWYLFVNITAGVMLCIYFLFQWLNREVFLLALEQPFWHLSAQTWLEVWFWGALALLVVGIVGGCFRYRERISAWRISPVALARRCKGRFHIIIGAVGTVGWAAFSMVSRFAADTVSAGAYYVLFAALLICEVAVSGMMLISLLRSKGRVLAFSCISAGALLSLCSVVLRIWSVCATDRGEVAIAIGFWAGVTFYLRWVFFAVGMQCLAKSFRFAGGILTILFSALLSLYIVVYILQLFSAGWQDISLRGLATVCDVAPAIYCAALLLWL